MSVISQARKIQEAVICHALPGSVKTRQELSGRVRNGQDSSGHSWKHHEAS
jgi:hypothetical protein